MIDSSIYKQQPKLNSELFIELIKCVRAGIFELYISEVIEQEFLTWAQMETQASFDSVVKATESLNKYYEAPSLFGKKLQFNSTASVAHHQINGILTKVQENWNEFKSKTSAKLLRIDCDHAGIVMSSYFYGKVPFSKAKNRNDIPDAFIYCCLMDLLKDNEKIIFISSDKKFTSLIKNESLLCFESMAALFSDGRYGLSEDFLGSLPENNLKVTLFEIYQDDIGVKMKRAIEFSDLVGEIEERLIDYAIGEHDRVSSDVEILNIDSKNISNISDNSILLFFSALVRHSSYSLAGKQDVYSLSEQRRENIETEVDDNGDFKITEKYSTNVEGHISVAFENLNPKTWTVKPKSYFLSILDDLFEPEIQEISVVIEDIKEI